MQNFSGQDESDSEISPSQKMTSSASTHSLKIYENKCTERFPIINSKIKILTRSMSEISFQCKVKSETKTKNSSFSSQTRTQGNRMCLKRKISVVKEEDEEYKDNQLILNAVKKFEDERKNLNKN